MGKKNEGGGWTRSHGEITTIGAIHFQNIYKYWERVIIVEIIKLTYFFTIFVTKEQNVNLLEGVSKEALRLVLPSFKKDKSPNLDGWTIEFFLGFVNWLKRTH